MSRRKDWRRSKWREVEEPAPAPVRIWREVLDHRTGEVRVEEPIVISPLSRLMNAIYKQPLRSWSTAEALRRYAQRDSE